MFPILFVLGAQVSAANACTPPAALITLDVSGTMRETTNGKTKFEWAKRGIASVMDAPGVRGGTIEQEVGFGLSVFPNPAETSPPAPNTGFCSLPEGDTGFLRVGFGTSNKAAISDSLASLGQLSRSNDTPIYQALLYVAKHALFPLETAAGKRAVILITDGMQDCCKQGDYDSTPDCISGSTALEPNEAKQNREDIIALARALKAQDIKIYAVGFGDKVDPLMLGGVAVAAGTERDPEHCDPQAESSLTDSLCYYAVDTAGAGGLELALRDIIGKIQAEECNGVDDDCDGNIDEDLPPKPCGGASCGGQGTQTCVDGKLSACSAVQPKEVCDGKDNDCDGIIDAIPCSTACGPGLMHCFGGKLDPECHALEVGTELCNGRDDNCDGVVDEGCEECAPGSSAACTKGSCSGAKTCRFGAWSACEAEVNAEVCDGEDNDCDGEIDNGASLCPGGACVNGKCSPGLGVTGGVPEAEAFVYRGQGLSRACQSSESTPEFAFLLALLLPLLKRKRS